jgi:hypothetical protein
MLVQYVDKGKTIDHDYFINFCISPLVKAINKQRPKSGTHGLKLLIDGAKPHTHSETIHFIQSNGLLIIDHPPYSPDLAPCDYWLFDLVKQRLNEQEEFEDEKSLAKSVTKILHKIPHNEYIKTFDKYLERLKMCIDAEEEYFEHNMK